MAARKHCWALILAVGPVDRRLDDDVVAPARELARLAEPRLALGDRHLDRERVGRDQLGDVPRARLDALEAARDPLLEQDGRVGRDAAEHPHAVEALDLAEVARVERSEEHTSEFPTYTK